MFSHLGGDASSTTSPSQTGSKKHKELITEQSLAFCSGHVFMLQIPQTAISLQTDQPQAGALLGVGGMIPLPEDNDISNKQSVIKDATRKAEGENDSGPS